MRSLRYFLFSIGILCTVAAWGSEIPESKLPGVTYACVDSYLSDLFERFKEQPLGPVIRFDVLEDNCNRQLLVGADEDGKLVVWFTKADSNELMDVIRRFVGKGDEVDPCSAVSTPVVRLRSTDYPQLESMIDELSSLRISPVPSSFLYLHGLRYEVRIETPISRSSFAFDAPARSTIPVEERDPLDRWFFKWWDVVREIGAARQKGGESRQQDNEEETTL